MREGNSSTAVPDPVSGALFSSLVVQSVGEIVLVFLLNELLNRGLQQ